MRRALLLFVFCMGCGRACAAPKPQGDDPSPSIDAAPTSGELPPRCEVEREVATGEGLEIGRMATHGTSAVLGARKRGRPMIAEIDLAQPTAKLELIDLAPASSAAIADLPPPVPVRMEAVAGDRLLAVGYEPTASKLAPCSSPSSRFARACGAHIVVRDVASPSAPVFELPPEDDDESLAFDALATGAGLVIVWDAPVDEGSAVFAATFSPGGQNKPAVRVSPALTDADTPRLARGPSGVYVVFLAHRPLPKTDAAALPEGPGQDPEHAWLEMVALSSDGQVGAAARLTAESGSVTSFDLATAAGSTDFDVVARDGVELGAGQGGRVLLAAVQNGGASASVVIAEHVGRGAPAFFPAARDAVLFFTDPSERGRSSVLAGGNTPAVSVAFEPALDGARPLGVAPSTALVDAGDDSLRLLTASAITAAGAERSSTALRILRCKRALRTNVP